MNAHHGSDKHSAFRVQAVEHYLSKGSLDTVASTFKIHPSTLKRWLKWYREGGKENLKRKHYKRYSRRFSPQLEKKVVLLKERNPGLTIIEARKKLKNMDIMISTGGIWKVWYRYNLIGFYKKKEISLKKVISKSPEIEREINKAKEYLKKKNIKQAAQIVNALPSCPDKDVLSKIPDRLLSLPKRLKKFDLIFHEIPSQERIYKARAIRKEAEKGKLFYTSLRAGVLELCALDWSSRGKEQLTLAQELRKKIDKFKGRGSSTRHLLIEILMAETRALAHLGKIEDAFSSIKKFEYFCRRISYSRFSLIPAFAYSAIGDYKRSRYWVEKSLVYNRDDKITQLHLASNLAMAGDYNSTKRVLKNLNKEQHTGTKTIIVIIQAFCSAGQGNIEEAIYLANHALSLAEKRTVPDYLWNSSLIVACCLCALGEKTKAKKLIKKVDTQLKKFNIKKVRFLAALLLNQRSLPHDATLMPIVKFSMLLRKASRTLRIKDYRRAYNYAKTQQLMGLFHRLILFFPESANKLIAKGKATGLPEALLRLPVFQKDIPVYHIKFLGSVYIYCNNVKLHYKLAPLYTSFLLHLCFKKKVAVELLCKNFWSRAKDPRGSLSHLLVNLRKYLRLPSHTLIIKGGILYFKRYVTTDNQFYRDTIIRAKALERIGEWSFARREYLRAFMLFRGEPFKKMYDPWSEQMRWVILNKLETEVLHFAKSCLEHNNKADAKKVFEKVSKIIPQSEKIRSMVSRFG